jgi:two-component system phosphate regulon sensor histidine kinase PhoR
MKNLRPGLLLFTGCLILFLVTFCSSLLLQGSGSFTPNLNAFITALVASTCAFFIFYFALKRFVQNRLQNIFRILQSPPTLRHKNVNELITEAERHVNVLNDYRIREIKQLKVQDEFRKEFIGNLSHELKTPIFSIQGFLDSLLDGALENPEINRNFIERASIATDRMVQLIEDLDQITKLESTELKIVKRPFELTELLKEIIDTLELQAKEKNINLKLAKEYPLTFVMGDRNKLFQVFTNLLRNSISYGNVDGTTEVFISPIDDLILIEVADNGIGIDPNHWPRVFERFYRVEKSRSRHEGGTGLGLAIVKHILEAHGQSITLRSTAGVGTTFSFSLEKSPKNLQLSSRGIPIN